MKRDWGRGREMKGKTSDPPVPVGSASQLSPLQDYSNLGREGNSIQGQVHNTRTGHEGPEGEKRYNSTLSLTSALDGGGWSMSCPGCFTLGKTQYPLHRRLVGPQGRSGIGAENLAPTRIRSPGCPACSESLYQLSYPSHSILGKTIKNFSLWRSRLVALQHASNPQI